MAELLKIFGNEIVRNSSKYGPIITHVGGNFFTEHCYKKRVSDTRTPYSRTLLLEDIRKKVYVTNSYPPSDRFLDEVQSDHRLYY